MSATQDIITALMAGGMDAGAAAALVAQSAVEMTVKMSAKSVGAVRQQRYRERHGTVTKRNESVTERNADKTSPSVTKRNESVTTLRSEETPLSISNNIKKVERQNRGSRIAPDWSPSDAERSFARQQGFSEFEVQREVDKFRDWWAACAGSKGVKLDWAATWRQWVRNGAERAGKAPLSVNGTIASGYYAKPDSEQLEAWDRQQMAVTGKRMPRDRNGGWRVSAEWPPGYVRQPLHDPPPAPIVLRFPSQGNSP